MSRRLTALVIGNAAYPGPSKLKNPRNDADDIATQLDSVAADAQILCLTQLSYRQRLRAASLAEQNPLVGDRLCLP